MQTLQLAPEYELIRTPETGLVQLQARMGGSATVSSPETPR
jgi:alpha-D-ribose 1-methylphosphonate 5-triphosphate synthase subunit PhnG